ncbi:hypothetical protein IAG44_06555 [Streptomyces roseirectus]|uniref:MmyB-like transcription regulator ligand binding domain-containing protein n=1 Tax=Streptomyces roseirectus TaxID=2768066 RepID=A0A7H0I8M0_9ACTN|nr:hypothetical protein [Streptomyces roseirectus]QNP69136.1 hypothetical protein IAG44_06555 [Streptomyces roseirectus]
MTYRAGGQRSESRPFPEGPEAHAYLQDYAALLDAVSFPSVVLDRRWDAVIANTAFRTLFAGIGPHPTAMPDDNFLRFVLFHPDASTVLGDHESRWCLPLLAQFAAALEQDPDDRELQAIRREIAQDPIMEAAYRHGLPRWIHAVGPEASALDGAVRPLLHPDPRWGAVDCRIVTEAPRALQDMGCSRLTLVLREPRRVRHAPRRAGGRTRRATGHLTVVPTPEG